MKLTIETEMKAVLSTGACYRIVLHSLGICTCVVVTFLFHPEINTIARRKCSNFPYNTIVKYAARGPDKVHH